MIQILQLNSIIMFKMTKFDIVPIKNLKVFLFTKYFLYILIFAFFLSEITILSCMYYNVNISNLKTLTFLYLLHLPWILYFPFLLQNLKQEGEMTRKEGKRMGKRGEGALMPKKMM